MEYQWWRFSRYRAQVDVMARPGIMQSLVSSMLPYTHAQEITATDASNWKIIANHSTSTSTDGYERHVISSPGEPRGEALVSRKTKLICLEEREDEWLVLRTRRMLRNLLRMQLAMQGAIFLHGGMVIINGSIGVAYIGASKAGKTSSVLAALTQGAAFVTNDDLTVLIGDGIPLALGWPRSIYVRRDTLGVLGLPSEFWEALTLIRPIGAALDQEFVSFSPGEIAEMFRCQIISDAPLTHLVFPQFSSELSSSGPLLQPLSAQEALSLLSAHLEPGVDAYHQWLDNVPPGRYEIPLVNMLARVRCSRLHQSFSDIVATASMLKGSLLESQVEQR